MNYLSIALGLAYLEIASITPMLCSILSRLYSCRGPSAHPKFTYLIQSVEQNNVPTCMGRYSSIPI